MSQTSLQTVGTIVNHGQTRDGIDINFGSWEKTVYPAMSGKIRAHFDDTKFWDMGTPERLKKLEDFLDSRAI